ncbi:hypothetical protein QMT40_002999 [Parvibaculaceae bacterium PLY_AMNH_Bact1]|nr:hypothetical protein QMT40_002999 [Parvibaculaceae bacterium PLY_AMNH_Bact1]
MSDIWDAAKGVLGTVAPTIATAFGGPLAGMAARAVTGALLGEERASDKIDEAMLAIQGASAEDLHKLKAEENRFAEKMRELEIDVERIHAGDRDSARKRQMQTKDKMPGYIASAALVGFFSILGALIFVDLPSASTAPLQVMLGVLGGLVGQIANYYFGSSASSSRKNEIMNAVLNGRNGGAANG